MILWLSVTSSSVGRSPEGHVQLPFVWSYPRKSFRDSPPWKKAVWNRVKLPTSDGIFCQGTFPGNSLSKTNYRQGGKTSQRPWYPLIQSYQWLTLQSPHRWHGDKVGQGLLKSLWGPFLFQRNNQLLSHGSRTHSWTVSVHLDAAAQKCHSSVPAQRHHLQQCQGSAAALCFWCYLSVDLASSFNPTFQRTFYSCHIAEPWRLSINSFIVLSRLEIFIGILCSEWIQLTQNRNYCKTKRPQHKLRHFSKNILFSSELFMLSKSF